jgi:hypothetical protein
VVVTVAGFLLSGAALLFHQDWWTVAGAVAAVASALLLIVYFHPLAVLGLVIDAFVLSLVIWHWPARELPREIVGTVRDDPGRWAIASSIGFIRPGSAQLRALDARGRVTPVRRGRPVVN